MMKALREGNKIKPNLGNDVFIESEVGAAVFAGIDLPLQMGHKQPPHTSNSENSTLKKTRLFGSFFRRKSDD